MHSKVYVSNMHSHGIVYVQVIFALYFGNLIRDNPVDAFYSLTKESQQKESEFHRGQMEISSPNSSEICGYILFPKRISPPSLACNTFVIVGLLEGRGEIRAFQFITEINGYQL